MSTSLVTAPTSQPITLGEMKTHLRVSGNDDDILINDLIVAATEDAEIYTWRKFITQTWTLYLSEFNDTIKVPFGRIQSVSSIKYYDNDNLIQTELASIYDVVTSKDFATINLAYNQSWSDTYEKENAIEIEFVCGYGGSAAVPQMIKSAIKIKVEMLYGNLFANEHDQLYKTYTSLLDPYRLYTF